MSTLRIHVYLLKEIALPAGLGLLTFTFVLLMGRILRLVEMVINKGVPLEEIGKLFLYLIPSFLVLTIPLSFLLGTLIGFTRLSVDSEIIALRASGIGLYALTRPVLLAAVPVCLTVALLTLAVAPASNTAFRSQIFQIAKSRASVGFQPQVFNDDFDGLVLYANQIDEGGGTLEGVFISDERFGSSPSVILAGRGRLIEDRDALSLTLRLENGAIHRRPKGSREGDAGYQTLTFATYDINLNMGQELPSPDKRRRKESELSLGELEEAWRQAPTPEAARALQVQWHKRFAMPLAPLAFALIAVPLGLRPHRSGRGGGLALALMVFLAYYLCLTLAETLATDGAFPPLPALWLPNLLFLAAGGYLLRLKAREQEFPWPRWPARLRRRKDAPPQGGRG